MFVERKPTRVGAFADTAVKSHPNPTPFGVRQWERTLSLGCFDSLLDVLAFELRRAEIAQGGM